MKIISKLVGKGCEGERMRWPPRHQALPVGRDDSGAEPLLRWELDRQRAFDSSIGEAASGEGHGMKRLRQERTGNKSDTVQYGKPQNKSVQMAKSLPRYRPTMISHTVELCNFA